MKGYKILVGINILALLAIPAISLAQLKNTQNSVSIVTHNTLEGSAAAYEIDTISDIFYTSGYSFLPDNCIYTNDSVLVCGSFVVRSLNGEEPILPIDPTQ